MITLETTKIAIIGLGYVGLPLAVEFGKHYDVLGFDINQKRIDELEAGHDSTLEVEDADLQAVTKLKYSSNPRDLEQYDVSFVHALPTQ